MINPETLPEEVVALRALVLTAWAERDTERAEKARLADQNDRLRELIRQLQRMQFGRHSGRLDPDQFSLALEDLEQAVAATEAEQEKADPGLRQSRVGQRRASRGALPEHLPRVEVVIEPEEPSCPGCGGAMHVIGEDCSQRLDCRRRVIIQDRDQQLRDWIAAGRLDLAFALEIRAFYAKEAEGDCAFDPVGKGARVPPQLPFHGSQQETDRGYSNGYAGEEPGGARISAADGRRAPQPRSADRNSDTPADAAPDDDTIEISVPSRGPGGTIRWVTERVPRRR